MQKNVENVNGRVSLSISEDQLEVYADFYPAEGRGIPLMLDDVESFIDENEINYGIKWDVLKSSLLYVNSERQSMHHICIAEGKPPEKEVPSYIQMAKKLFQHSMGFDQEKGRVDWKDVKPYIIVHKGQQLAKIIHKKEGEEGISVKGENIPYGKKEIIQFEPGENTKQEGEFIVALQDGCFQTEGRSFSINQVLEINSGINYSTGHISFPGDVIINGEIKDGFHIMAGGSVFCKNTLDASVVMTKKDLTVGLGIIGRLDALIRVEGDIYAVFVDNCRVEGLSDIHIKREIVKSQISCTGILEMGSEGKILSSHIIAGRGVSLGSIGKEGSAPSTIECGISFTVKRRLDHIKEKLAQLSKKKSDVLRRAPVLSDENMEHYIQDLQEMIDSYTETMGILYEELDVTDGVCIKIHGRIYPGTMISISNYVKEITEPQKHIEFYLDKKSGQILSRPLTT